MILSCPGVRPGTVQKLIDYLYSGQTTIKNKGQKEALDAFVNLLDMNISLDEEAVSLTSTSPPHLFIYIDRNP